jgi:hypothetical protein
MGARMRSSYQEIIEKIDDAVSWRDSAALLDSRTIKNETEREKAKHISMPKNIEITPHSFFGFVCIRHCVVLFFSNFGHEMCVCGIIPCPTP